jgi:Ca2+-binding EF-hand superfamily protein
MISNGEEYISFEGLLKVARLSGLNPSNQQMIDAVAAAGLEESESYCAEDCVTVVISMQCDQDNSDDIRASFEQFDKDKNGFLDAFEFKQYMMSSGEQLSPEEAQEMMTLFDTDGDGKIKYEGMLCQ